MNRDYVAIKVDREERPDVDRIYMTFVQATTGSGGWPMSVWLTPELKPFFGGTYFPPENRWGHPGFGSILTQIAQAWHSDREKIDESARNVVEQLKKHVEVAPNRAGPPFDAATLESAFSIFRRTFDSRLGGFGGAPKFPRVSVHHFLLRYYARTKNQEALDMVLLTLREMARGGMNDQLGGGFHRYSVDDRWFVPHFEKMLYDQAQIAISYLEAFQITGDRQYADTARAHLRLRPARHDRCRRRLLLRRRCRQRDRSRAPRPQGRRRVLHLEHRRDSTPCWASRPRTGSATATASREGSNVRQRSARRVHRQEHPLPGAHRRGDGAPFQPAVRRSAGRARSAPRSVLMAARAKRVRPHLDDKILTAWNGLMISAFAKGGAVLDDAALRRGRAARRGIRHRPPVRRRRRGILLRRYRAGDAAIPGFLDDYALFVQGLLDLYEAQFDLRHLELAVRLTEKQQELFEDTASGGFFSTAADDTGLVLRVKEDYDGAEPSGNSVAVLNLLRLAQMTNRAAFRESAERTLAAFASRLQLAPVAIPQMLAACEFLLGEPREIILAGARDSAEMRALLRELHTRFVPNRVVLLVDSPEARRALAAGIPSIESMTRRWMDVRARTFAATILASCRFPNRPSSPS